MEESFIYRLAAQAEEAENSGLTKLAEHLSAQMERRVAENNHSQDLSSFAIESALWDLFLKRAEPKNGKFQALKVQHCIESLAKDIEQTYNNLIK